MVKQRSENKGEISELSLSEVLKTIGNHKGLVITIAVVVGLANAAVQYFLIKNTYVSKAMVMPKTSQSAGSLEMVMGQMGGASPLGGLLGGGIDSESRKFRQIVETDAVSNKIIEAIPDLNLKLGKLKKRLKLRTQGLGFYLEFEHENPKIATEVVTQYLNALQDFLKANIVTQSKNAENFIRERLKKLNAEIDETEIRLHRLRTGESRPDTKGRSTQSELVRIERELLRQNKLLELLEQQYELAQIESNRNDPMFVTVEPPTPGAFIGPKRLENSIIGLVAGLIIGCLGLIAWGRFKTLIS